jgi:ribosomal protein S16
MGDANTNFFHIIMANSRRKKKVIHSLESNEGVTVSQQDKHKMIYNHYLRHIGTYVPRSYTLNLTELSWEKR